MAAMEADKVRPMPKIDTSKDNDLITMAMSGAFLSGYYQAKQAAKVMDKIEDFIDDPAAVNKLMDTGRKIALDMGKGAVVGGPIGSIGYAAYRASKGEYKL